MALRLTPHRSAVGDSKPDRHTQPDRSDLAAVAHLFRRFFQVAFARPLTGDEAAEVAAALLPALLDLFTAQGPADQRHAHTVTRR